MKRIASCVISVTERGTRDRASVRVVNLSAAGTRYAPTLTMTFNVDDHFHLEMIVNINVIILERVLADSI